MAHGWPDGGSGRAPRESLIGRVIVLALNCGSSSLKFQLAAVEGPTTRPLGRGSVERIGGTAAIHFEQEGRPPLRESTPIADHEVAVRRAIDWIRAGPTGFDAVGHRVVHGGERFVQPALIDATVAGGTIDHPSEALLAAGAS